MPLPDKTGSITMHDNWKPGGRKLNVSLQSPVSQTGGGRVKQLPLPRNLCPMLFTQKFIRFSLAVALVASLGACTVVPIQPVGYRAPPVYVETYSTYPAYPIYPTYRYGYPSASVYYESNHRHYYDNRGGNRYRDDRDDERRYREPQRSDSPLESAAQMHRDVRRSLSLPRLPGMP